MSAMVDEMDLGAGLGEPAPEIASDPAGAVDGGVHAHRSPRRPLGDPEPPTS